MIKTHRLLGYAGLIPFLGLPLLAVSGILPLAEASAAFEAYGAVILSFFGGVYWLQSLQESDAKRAVLAMLPSIVAWFSVVLLADKLALVCLLVAFLLVWLYDGMTLRISNNYMRLRTELTATVCGCHLWMIWLVW